MSEDVTLKPCPFCGGEPTVLTDELYDGSFSIECCQVGCRVDVQGETYDSEEEDKAIKHWNTRAGEQAAYERGVQEGREAERGRLRAAVRQLQSLADRHKRSKEAWDGVNEQQFALSAQAQWTYEDAINIVNNPPVLIVCIECGNPPLYVYGGQGMCRECADKQRK